MVRCSILPREIWESILEKTDSLTCLTFCRSNTAITLLRKQPSLLRKHLALTEDHTDIIEQSSDEEEDDEEEDDEDEGMALWNILMRSAVQEGNLGAVQIMVQKRVKPPTMESLAASNAAHIYDWLCKVRPHDGYSSPFWRAACHGDLETFRWMKEEKGRFCSSKDTEIAAERGHQHIIEWLHNNNSSTRAGNCFTPAVMDFAAAHGHMQLIQFLSENRSEGCTPAAMDWAAAHGHLETVKFLHKHRTEGCTSKAMDGAAAAGHIQIVKFLHENRSEGCTTEAVDSAACQGRLHAVKWLLENRGEGCTTRAMDAAARHGWLEMVQWLHNNRSEGCSTAAIDGAAARGHLDVVRWLIQHRSEGCTKAAMDNAAGGGHIQIIECLHSQLNAPYKWAMDRAAMEGAGHLDVVKWFFNRGMYDKKVSVNDTMESAAGHGFLDILSWLHEESRLPLTAAMMSRAAEDNQLLIMEWLHENGAPCSWYAMTRAARQGHLAALKWLHARRENDKGHYDLTEKAVKSGSVRIVRWLVDNGLETSWGKIRSYASCWGSRDVMKWATKEEAKANTVSS